MFYVSSEIRYSLKLSTGLMITNDRMDIIKIQTLYKYLCVVLDVWHMLKLAHNNQT